GAADGGLVRVPSRPARDEWWLLKSGERTVGTRHLLVLPRDGTGAGGLRLEEHLVFLPQGQEPGASVDRIEDVRPDFSPVHLHYVEHGDAGRGRPPYETVRSGPVEGTTWHAGTRTSSSTTTRDVALPAGARAPRQPGRPLNRPVRAAGHDDSPGQSGPRDADARGRRVLADAPRPRVERERSAAPGRRRGPACRRDRRGPPRRGRRADRVGP